LTRDEVASLKKTLAAAIESLGQATSGYSKEHESHNLPTEAYFKSGTTKYNLTNASASRELCRSKSAESASKGLEKEYKEDDGSAGQG
jgi:hypothetical protein